jgi:hypothetical protein
MARKIKLKTRPEPVYYTILGISCHYMDYRFMHLINKAMDVNFSREDDLTSSLPASGRPATFSFYSFKDEDQRNIYYLISNLNEDFILIPELKHIDYIMLIEGDFKKKKKDALLSVIRSVQKVQMAFEIKVADFKNAESFLTDVEMHISDIQRKIKSKKQPII